MHPLQTIVEKVPPAEYLLQGAGASLPKIEHSVQTGQWRNECDDTIQAPSASHLYKYGCAREAFEARCAGNMQRWRGVQTDGAAGPTKPAPACGSDPPA